MQSRELDGALTVLSKRLTWLQLMDENDGFGRITSWDLKYFNDDAYYEQVYDYYVRSRYDFIVSSAGFD